jgi:hypothetical protein
VVGESVADWFAPPNEDKRSFTVAWTGQNAESRRQGQSIRLFKTTWQNPEPAQPIRSLDFVWNPPGPAAPFLVALTAEP